MAICVGRSGVEKEDVRLLSSTLLVVSVLPWFMSVEVVVSFFPGVDFAPAVVMVVGAEVSVVPI